MCPFPTERVSRLRPLMEAPEKARLVPRVLAGAGIRFVIVEHLSQTKMDGAALCLDSTRLAIALSLRYPRMDYFWFTLLHELAHIMEDDGEYADVDVIGSEEIDAIEKKANEKAASWLVPPEKMESFITRTSPLYSESKIVGFARKIGVHPSIIVGQLKYRGELSWERFKRLQSVDVRSVIKESAVCDGWGNTIAIAE